eukprot:TRINITY_DN14972_c0_g1_i3.p1 TRINITY_DN14972_c0_g1~~TRINITY_DN14972_c0_g1_i3.p1  ORF type:complete len:137 (-),score=5.91 TRINITY_DN14972_c0_g1_i3:197-607(-)
MGRRRIRYEKNFFDFTLGQVGFSGEQRYIDAFHRDAGKQIKLRHLTDRIRVPVNKAAATGQKLGKDDVIHGIAHTDICKPVTLETLTQRMGVAQAVRPYLEAPAVRSNYRKRIRAQRLTEMHEPYLTMEGPFERGP